jgi:ribosomal protein S18 acetylase RimI-like enzyme
MSMQASLIRAATDADIPALAALNAAVQELHVANRPDQFKAATSSELEVWFAQLLQNPSAKVWLAELAGAVVGYLVVQVRQSAENTFCRSRSWWDIDQIGVHAEHRRSGVCRALMRKVVHEARTENIRSVELVSWAFNRDAQRALTSLGFAPKLVRFELSLTEDG